MEKHDERCKKCKKRVFELLSKMFGEVKTNYNLHISNNPDSYINTPFYSDLKTIYSALQNYRGFDHFTRSKMLPNVDYFVVNPGIIVEFDESQHFTKPREIALRNYPEKLKLCFDKKRWIDQCRSLHKKDNYPPFRDEQRAWYDTVRDFAPISLHLKPTVRLFSKEIMWCKLNPNNINDLETFKRFIIQKQGISKIKVGLVSFSINSLDHSSIINHSKIFLDVVNKNKDLDIIVFSGWTLLKKQLEIVKKKIENKNSLILFEVWDDVYNGVKRHKGYFFNNGILIDREIIQIFATSKEINKDKKIMVDYLQELKKNRIIEYKGMKICWIICGEINVLTNAQNDKNRVSFRYKEEQDLNEIFEEIFKEVDVFINPTHTIMGNQGKLARRREFLSQNKIFCSVSNADILKNQKLSNKSLQYFYKNGEDRSGILLESSNEFILKKYS